MDIKQYEDYLNTLSYADLRQLAVDLNVFKNGSKRKDALIKKLVMHHQSSNDNQDGNSDSSNHLDSSSEAGLNDTFIIGILPKEENKVFQDSDQLNLPIEEAPKKVSKKMKKKKGGKENVTPEETSESEGLPADAKKKGQNSDRVDSPLVEAPKKVGRKMIKKKGLKENAASDETSENEEKGASADVAKKVKNSDYVDSPLKEAPKKVVKKMKKRKGSKENATPEISESDNKESPVERKMRTRRMAVMKTPEGEKESSADDRRKTFSVELRRSKRSATPVISKGSATPIISKGSATPIILKGSATPIISKGSVTPIISKAATPMQQEPAKVEDFKDATPNDLTEGDHLPANDDRRRTFSVGRKRKISNSAAASPLVGKEVDGRHVAKKLRGSIGKGIVSRTPGGMEKETKVVGNGNMRKALLVDNIKNRKGWNVTFCVDSPDKTKTPSKFSLFNNIKKTPKGTPMRASIAATSSARKNGTPLRKKSVPNSPGITFSATKMPNFAKIHERNFANMESLQSYTERKANRAVTLLSPLSKSFSIGSGDTSKSNVSKKSNIPIRKKSLKKLEEEVTSTTGRRPSLKTRSVTVQSIRETNEEVIKGVRANRRFLLLMKSRNLLES